MFDLNAYGQYDPANPFGAVTGAPVAPKKRPMYASLYDRFGHNDANSTYKMDDGDKQRSFRQGLLQFAAQVSQPNGGNFAAALSKGLLAGSTGMNEDYEKQVKLSLDSAKVKAMDGAPAAFRAADMAAQAAGYEPGTPEYENAMAVHLHTASAASNAGIVHFMVPGADGKQRPARQNPSTGQVEVWDEHAGDFVPQGGAMRAMPGSP